MEYVSKSLDGISVQYVDKGRGDILVFIHGYGVTPRAYEDNINLLSTSYRVIAPKLHKFGSIEEKITILNRLLESLDNSPVVLLGHSASGILAVLLASQFPKYIHGIILVDSTGIQDGRGKKDWIIYWIRHVFGLFNPSGKRSPTSLLLLAYEFLYEVLRHPKASYQQADVAISINLVPYLEKLSIPVLVLWGKQDDLTPVSESFVFLDALKHVELDIVPGNHDWLKLHPEILKEKVDMFMEKLSVET